MAENAIVQARIDTKVKDEARAVLATMGLTMSDAVRLLMIRIAHDKALPLDLLAPNATTRAAMEEAKAGGLQTFDSVEALMAALDADD